MSRRKVSTTVYLTREQTDALQALTAQTGVPVARYIRDGVDIILERYGCTPVAGDPVGAAVS